MASDSSPTLDDQSDSSIDPEEIPECPELSSDLESVSSASHWAVADAPNSVTVRLRQY